MLISRGKVMISVNNKLKFCVRSFMEVWTLKEVIAERQYEKYRSIKDSDTVIDIGAAIGEFSIYAAVKAELVIAYEVNEQRVSDLKHNMALNEITNIKIVNGAAVSLNDIMEGVDYCDFLKIDCEGCEYGLFQDVKSSTLERVGYIAMEVHLFNENMKSRYEELVIILESNNFDVRFVPNEVHDYLALVYASKNDITGGALNEK